MAIPLIRAAVKAYFQNEGQDAPKPSTTEPAKRPNTDAATRGYSLFTNGYRFPLGTHPPIRQPWPSTTPIPSQPSHFGRSYELPQTPPRTSSPEPPPRTPTPEPPPTTIRTDDTRDDSDELTRALGAENSQLREELKCVKLQLLRQSRDLRAIRKHNEDQQNAMQRALLRDIDGLGGGPLNVQDELEALLRERRVLLDECAERAAQLEDLRRIVRVHEGKDAMPNWEDAMAHIDRSFALAHEVDRLNKELEEAKKTIVERGVGLLNSLREQTDATADSDPNTTLHEAQRLARVEIELRRELQEAHDRVEIFGQEIGRQQMSLEECHEMIQRLQQAGEGSEGTKRPEQQLSDLAGANAQRSLAQQIPDGTFTEFFQQIGMRVNSIVQMFFHVLGEANSPPLTREHVERMAPVDILGFYGDDRWNPLSIRDRHFQLQSAVFEILHKTILSEALFGIHNMNNFIYAGAGLPEFEALLLGTANTPHPIPQESVTNWRLSTIDLASQLNIPNHLPFMVAREIFFFLQPLFPPDIVWTNRQGKPLDDELRWDVHLSRNPTSGELEDWNGGESIRTFILDTCVMAYELRMKMRRSKDEWRCETLSREGYRLQSLQDGGDPFFVPKGVVGPGELDTASLEVAYLLFGALVKVNGEGEGQGRAEVMVKAEAVMKRRDGGEVRLVKESGAGE
ncbi:hypothetical protein B0T16DRAFT_496691 [Cercophora newfieldiana]|uniref:Uncharacterized protein n=1 Tax=Cercophora newfieldiana TaxID=92897 RepID=A0AA40CKV5_9PEZI|nr:hypothetical protein B0T16DRAFT_496691 [Cercophora newfieldiana]